MKVILIFIIKLYQLLISPILPQSCRFYPTCSDYFIQALQKKGIFKGIFLGFYRILRCNPFSKGGYDPVPEYRQCSCNDSKLKTNQSNG